MPPKKSTVEKVTAGPGAYALDPVDADLDSAAYAMGSLSSLASDAFSLSSANGVSSGRVHSAEGNASSSDEQDLLNQQRLILASAQRQYAAALQDLLSRSRDDMSRITSVIDHYSPHVAAGTLAPLWRDSPLVSSSSSSASSSASSPELKWAPGEDLRQLALLRVELEAASKGIISNALPAHPASLPPRWLLPSRLAEFRRKMSAMGASDEEGVKALCRVVPLEDPMASFAASILNQGIYVFDIFLERVLNFIGGKAKLGNEVAQCHQHSALSSALGQTQTMHPLEFVGRHEQLFGLLSTSFHSRHSEETSVVICKGLMGPVWHDLFERDIHQRMVIQESTAVDGYADSFRIRSHHLVQYRELQQFVARTQPSKPLSLVLMAVPDGKEEAMITPRDTVLFSSDAPKRQLFRRSVFNILKTPCGCPKHPDGLTTWADCQEGFLQKAQNDFFRDNKPKMVYSRLSQLPHGLDEPSVTSPVMSHAVPDADFVKVSSRNGRRAASGRKKRIAKRLLAGARRSRVHQIGEHVQDYLRKARAIRLAVDPASGFPSGAHGSVVFDTGATLHITGDRHHLQNIRSLPTPITVKGLGSTRIKEVGDHPFLGLVHYSPGLPVTIMSQSVLILSQPKAQIHHDGVGLAATYAYTVDYRGHRLFFPHNAEHLLWFLVDARPLAGLVPLIDSYHYLPLETGTPQTNLPVTATASTTAASSSLAFTVGLKARLTSASLKMLDRLDDIHRSMGHPGNNILRDMVYGGDFAGISRTDFLQWVKLRGVCVACQVAKGTPAPQRVGESLNLPPSALGERIHVDLFSVHGAKGAHKDHIIMVEERSGFLRVRPMDSTSMRDVSSAIIAFANFLRGNSLRPRTIVTDRGAAFATARDILGADGLILDMIPVGHHAVIAERAIRTIKDRARATFRGLRYSLPTRFYGKLVADTAEVSNYMVNSRTKQPEDSWPALTDGTTPSTPYQLITGRTDALHILRRLEQHSFGKMALFHLPPTQYGHGASVGNRDEKSRRADWGFVTNRFPGSRHTVEVYFPRTGKTLCSSKQHHNKSEDAYVLRLWREMCEEDASSSVPLDLSTEAAPAMEGLSIISPPPAPLHRVNGISKRVKSHQGRSSTSAQQTQDTQTKPVDGKVSTMKMQSLAFHASLSNMDFSTTLRMCFPAIRVRMREAVETLPLALRAASDKEMSQIEQAGALEPVSHPPLGKTCGTALPVLEWKMKPDSTGIPVRTLTLRCVFDRRHSNVEEAQEDFFSPTSRFSSILALLNIAQFHAHQHLSVSDVTRAFLHSPVKGEYYLKIGGPMAESLLRLFPDKYTAFAKDSPHGKIIYARLRKSLYGLEEASRAWYEELSRTLGQEGFRPNPFDSAIFFRLDEGGLSIIAAHVDDLLITSWSEKAATKLLQTLDKKYGLRTQCGPHLKYVGVDIDIEVGKDGRKNIFLHQSEYEKELLATLPALKPEDLPTITDKQNFWKSPASATPLQGAEKAAYVSLLHKALFLSTRTRPSIGLVVSFLTSRKEVASTDDLKKLYHLMGFVKATTSKPEWRICIRPRNLQITSFSDASYATHTWMNRRASQYGYVLSLGGSLLLSKSAKTKVTCDSITAAEVLSLHESLREVLWARMFLEEMGIAQQRTLMYEDNKAAVDLSNLSSGFAGKSRHFEVKYFRVKDSIDAEEVKVQHIDSNRMTADHLTKPLSKQAFLHQAQQICGANIVLKQKDASVFFLVENRAMGAMTWQKNVASCS